MKNEEKIIERWKPVLEYTSEAINVLDQKDWADVAKELQKAEDYINENGCCSDLIMLILADTRKKQKFDRDEWMKWHPKLIKIKEVD